MDTIKRLRAASGKTQRQLADETGLNIAQIQKIEYEISPVQKMKLENAIALAKSLGCTVEELIK